MTINVIKMTFPYKMRAIFLSSGIQTFLGLFGHKLLRQWISVLDLDFDSYLVNFRIVYS